MKKIWLFILILLIFTISIYSVISYLLDFFSQNLIGFISKKYNLPIQATTLGIAFPSGISLHKFHINQENFDLKTKKVILYFDLIQLLKTRNILGAFNKISFVQPELTVNKVVPIAQLLPIEDIEKMCIDWKDGKIKVENIPNIPVIYTSYGNAILSVTLTSVNTELLLPSSSDKIKLKFLKDNKTQNWFANLSSEKFGTLRLKGMVTAEDELKGKVYLKINTSVAELDATGNFDVSRFLDPKITSRVEFNKCKILDKNFTGYVKLSYSSYTISADEISIASEKQTITASGVVDINGNIDSRIQLTNFSVHNFYSKLRGTANATILASGRITSPLITAAGKITNFELLKISKIPQAEFKFEYAENDYKLTGDLTSKKQKYFFLVTGKKTLLEDRKKYIGEIRIKGKKSITGEFCLTNDEFQLANCIFAGTS
ncbi:MAG: hypothetical protein QME68_02205, partial [Elusimicrobiota bacterium]|nr:hypothetical protein [Elusimicrobiota bacterium]